MLCLSQCLFSVTINICSLKLGAYERGYSMRMQDHFMEYRGINYSLTSKET